MAQGLLERLVSPRVSAISSPQRAITSAPSGIGGTSNPGNFGGLVSAYQRNATINAGLNLLATSAGEPKFVGKRRKRSQGQVKAARAQWEARGVRNRAGSMALDVLMARAGYVEETTDHPLVHLLNNPNPFLTGDELWGLVLIDRWLAGNSYVVKARTALGNVAELWRLRPDRVEIIADRDSVVAGYRYKVGSESFVFPRRDVMHFKAPNPMDPYYYGMPALLPVIDAIDIDNAMRTYLKTFYLSGGSGPGAILTVEGELTAEEKDELRERKRRIFGGAAGAHEWLILDNTKSSFQSLGLDRGLAAGLPKEVAAMVAAELSMCLGIPGSILGQLIGYESSSYANKRADWQVLWDVTLTPLMGARDNVINASMLDPKDPEFGGIDEVCSDLGSIRALQEDEDALQERVRKNVQAGIWSFEEARLMTGMDPHPSEGTFLIPSNVAATPIERLGEEPEPAVPVDPPEVTVEPANLGSQIALGVRAARGRLPRSADAEARATWEKAVPMLSQGKSYALVADFLGVNERTLRRYRDTFAS